MPSSASALCDEPAAEEARHSRGLEHGFVDFDVCALDETWTGLRFMRRR